MMQTHYCDEHRTKFYRNEHARQDGQVRVWYSHKLLDGKGFCVEKDDQLQTKLEMPVQRSVVKEQTTPYHGMLACNAMNNAIALAVNGKIEVDQVSAYYKKIFSELSKNIV